MISCQLSHLVARCNERGYTFAQVEPCIVSRDGDAITVDETHEAYPRVKPVASGGAGTELKKLLGRIGIRSSPSCKCNARARELDARGVTWAEANTETVCGWLREESERRRLPFLPVAARLLVRRAIKNARAAGYV